MRPNKETGVIEITRKQRDNMRKNANTIRDTIFGLALDETSSIIDKLKDNEISMRDAYNALQDLWGNDGYDETGDDVEEEEDEDGDYV